MEYEIEDDGALYDYSTNPSLQPDEAIPSRLRREPSPQVDPADRRRLQKAEFIPEEDEQLA
jgi:hypothetical protein